MQKSGLKSSFGRVVLYPIDLTMFEHSMKKNDPFQNSSSMLKLSYLHVTISCRPTAYAQILYCRSAKLIPSPSGVLAFCDVSNDC